MKGCVVVVEDTASIRELLCDILEDADYQVVALGDPEQVLAAASRHQPDLFVIDVMLPKRSGIEVADQLWLNGFGEVPLIAISASSIMRDLARHSPLFHAVIHKPFDIFALLAEVDRLVTARRQGSLPDRLPPGP